MTFSRRRGARHNRRNLASGRVDTGSLIVDFSQRFQIDSSPGSLGVVDFAQSFSVTGDPAQAGASSPLARWGADLNQWHRGNDVTQSGGFASSWIDLSGKANHSIQATPAKQFAYVANDATCDNRPTLYCDGVDDLLVATGLTINLATEDVYFAFIFKQLSWTGASRCLLGGSGSTAPRLLANTASSPSMRQAATTTANTNSGAPVGTWVRGEVLWSVTPGVSYLKLGASEIKTGNPGTGTRTLSSIGAMNSGGVASQWIDVAIAELMCVKKAAGWGGPTLLERTDNDAYLAGIYPSAVY